MPGVPRIIHQTWKTTDVPQKMRELQSTWVDMHPQWEYFIWTDEDIEQFVKDLFPEIYESIWHKYKHQIQKIDVWRYLVLSEYGGVYADLDMQCLTPFDSLLAELEHKSGGEDVLAMGFEGQKHTDGTDQIGNALIVSTPGHPFWDHVIEHLFESQSHQTDKVQSALTTTGPHFIHSVYKANPQGVHVLPREAFYPLDWSKPSKDTIKLVRKRQYPRSWAVHHWEGFWRNSPMVHHFRVRQNETTIIEFSLVAPRSADEGRGEIENSLLRGRLWRDKALRYGLSQILTAGDTVVVAGPYNGFFAIPFAKAVGPKGCVHCFEPIRAAHTLIREGARLSGVSDRIFIESRILSDSTDMHFRKVLHNPRTPHRAIFRPGRFAGVESAQGQPLDSLPLSQLDLLVLRCEGEETRALQGAMRMIDRHKPVILAQIWNDYTREKYDCPFIQQQSFLMLGRLRYDYTMVDEDWYVCTPLD